MKAFLGIDTSCYTTSVAAVGPSGELLLDERIMLEVKLGDRGLRQSEGVFQHIKNSGEIFQMVKDRVTAMDIRAVAASVKPRPAQDSYMPVFVVGENVGKAIAGAKGIAFYAASHQENHIMAGIWSAGGPDADRFLAVHLSGGTTELLQVELTDTGFTTSIIGGSSDISAGQFIDRVGVAMGLPFPSGSYIEKLATGIVPGEEIAKIPSAVNGLYASFSGPESQAVRLLEKGIEKEELALAVLDCIARTLVKLLEKAGRYTGLNKILLIGGVSSNAYIRKYLEDRLDLELYFPHPRFCTDNAVGTALLAWKMDKKI